MHPPLNWWHFVGETLVQVEVWRLAVATVGKILLVVNAQKLAGGSLPLMWVLSFAWLVPGRRQRHPWEVRPVW